VEEEDEDGAVAEDAVGIGEVADMSSDCGMNRTSPVVLGSVLNSERSVHKGTHRT